MTVREQTRVETLRFCAHELEAVLDGLRVSDARLLRLVIARWRRLAALRDVLPPLPPEAA